MQKDWDTNPAVSREEEPPHTSHHDHGAKEISTDENKEFIKENLLLWMF